MNGIKKDWNMINHGRRRKFLQLRAFTLIELLVVIAVIALLSAVLLPALAKAKRQVKAVVCASGMKQIAVAFNAYGLDNHDCIIVASKVMTTADGSKPWIWALLPYICGDESTENTYVKPDKLWFCPADKDPYPLGFAPHGQEYTSYALNGLFQKAVAAGGWTQGSPELRFGPAGGYRYTQIKQSSGCMLMMETSYYGQVYDAENDNLRQYKPDAGGHHRNTSGFYHDGWMNLIFVDGHVDRIKGQDAKVVTIPLTIETGGYMFWPELSLPDSQENKTLWGPGYK